MFRYVQVICLRTNACLPLTQPIPLTLILLLLSACGTRRLAPIPTPVKTAQSNDGTLFVDFTNTHLPTSDLQGFSMDARPVDGDGDLDLLVGNEDGNRLLLNHGHGFFVDASEERLPAPQAAEESRQADFGDVEGDGSFDGDLVNIDGHIDLYVSSRVARIACCLGKLSVWVLYACSL